LSFHKSNRLGKDGLKNRMNPCTVRNLFQNRIRNGIPKA
jgi:hypothetical protein